MRMRPLLILPLAMLASCNAQKPAEPRSNTTEAVETANQAEVVAAMPTGSQNGILIRAIRDAQLPCQEVRSAEPQESKDRSMHWLVKCDGKFSYLVAIAPDGVATIARPPGF